jgi:hypothetical protein
MIKAEFSEYLRDIELSQPIIDRIIVIYDKYLPFFGDTIEDIFIEDIIPDTGERQYFDFLLFSKDNMYNIANFTRMENRFDIIPLPKRIDYLRLESGNYDFLHVQSNSRLIANFPMSFVTQTDLKASSKNCPHLLRILHKYIIPRVKP